MTRALILGAGVSGRAAARLAIQKGFTVTVFDEKPIVDLDPGVGFAGGSWDPILLNGIDLVVASPGFSERSAPIVDALEQGLRIWSEVEFAWRHLQSPVAAVTGTNGKTSVTEATAAMLDASGLDAPATGNIGAPLSDFANERYDALVVEVSSFQLRFVDLFHPMAAAITNVAIDHIDWHGSAYAYRQAKANIFKNQTSSDLLVFDADDEGAVRLAADATAEKHQVSGSRLPKGGSGVDGGNLVVGDVVIATSDLTSDDPSHLVNLAGAGVLARRMGATAEGVVAGAISYAPGAHRRSTVVSSGGVVWVDDSKATNPHAAVSSIRAHENVILIAGGLAKGIDLEPIVSEPGVSLIIGIGEAGPALVEAAGDRGRLAGSLEIAVEMAANASAPGDTVLLAPGCASFDQFTSYAERGDRFAELVNERLEIAR